MTFKTLLLLTTTLIFHNLWAQENADNAELKQLYESDQQDRKTGNLDWATITHNDSLRETRVYELLDSNKVLSSDDYYHAAMIFQHGNDTVSSGMAVKMMKKSVELDDSQSKWLLAAAIDRDLMRKKQAQIYGTQYTRSAKDEPWQLYLIDSTQISDAERKAFGVETLAQQREKLRKMNKLKLHSLLEQGKSVDEIISFIKKEDLKNSAYDLSENGINQFGYELMYEGNNEGALKILKTNVELYPNAYNTHDSLGEILLKMDRKEEGINAYKKSYELNPQNKNAEIILFEFGK